MRLDSQKNYTCVLQENPASASEASTSTSFFLATSWRVAVQFHHLKSLQNQKLFSTSAPGRYSILQSIGEDYPFTILPNQINLFARIPMDSFPSGILYMEGRGL